MQWKLVSAFATGTVLASVIVYVAVRPVDVRITGNAKPAAAAPPTEPVAPAPAPVVAAAPIPPAAPAPERPTPSPVHRIIREKRSPMPPPIRQHPTESVIAQASPAQAPPAPIRAPLAPEPTPAPAPQIATAPPARAENVPIENVSVQPPAVSTRTPNVVTLAAGTNLPVRIGETLSSAHNQPGDTFLATLSAPLVIDGWVIAERGARVEGRVLNTTAAGRIKGVSHLEIALVRLATSDGQNIRIRTEPYVKDGPATTGTDAAKVGVGAAIGAIIGALAGGGKGAGIGAGAGGAAGAGDVLLTRGKPAVIPVETRVSFRVQDSVTITERLN